MRMFFVRAAQAARKTSGAEECAYSSRKRCSTSQIWSMPSRSASSTWASASLNSWCSVPGPHGRGSWCSYRSPKRMASSSVGGPAAVDHQARPRHEARIVGGQEHDALGDVVGDAEPTDRMECERGLARLFGVVGADLAGTHDKGLLAHVGLDQAGMDRIDTDAVALAA